MPKLSEDALAALERTRIAVGEERVVKVLLITAYADGGITTDFFGGQQTDGLGLAAFAARQFEKILFGEVQLAPSRERMN